MLLILKWTEEKLIMPLNWLLIYQLHIAVWQLQSLKQWPRNNDSIAFCTSCKLYNNTTIQHSRCYTLHICSSNYHSINKNYSPFQAYINFLSNITQNNLKNKGVNNIMNYEQPFTFPLKPLNEYKHLKSLWTGKWQRPH